MSRDWCPDRVSRVNGNAFPLVTRYSLTRHFFVPRPFAHVTLSFVTRHSSLYPFLTLSPAPRRPRHPTLRQRRARPTQGAQSRKHQPVRCPRRRAGLGVPHTATTLLED